MIEQRVRLLLLDDNERLRTELKLFLELEFGYQVDAVGDRAGAVRLAMEADGAYDVALIDQVLAEGPVGIQVMQEIKALDQELEVIIFTGEKAELRQKALKAGAFRFLEKPVNIDELAELIRIAAQQVKLREISRTILSERDLGRVLEEITDAATSLASADDAAIVLLDLNSGRLEIHSRTRHDEPVWQSTLVEGSLSREIIETGTMTWIGDTERHGQVDPGVIDSGIRSLRGLPIPGEKHNLGVLYVYSHTPERFESWGTVSVLQTLAGQAGLALSNLQAFEQIRLHAGFMEALVQVGQGLTPDQDLDKQLDLLWDFVETQLQASVFSVALYDKERDTLEYVVFRDRGKRVPLSETVLGHDPDQWGLQGWTVKHGAELSWSTIDEREKLYKSLGIKPHLLGQPSRSCFCMPLKTGDEIVGAMSIQSYERHAFNPVLLNAFRALGSQLVVAMENTRLLESEAERRQEAETLRETALTLTTTLEPQEIFERILSELQKVVPYDSASVQLLRGAQLEIIGGRGFQNREDIIGFSFPLEGHNPNREVVRRRDWFIVSDAPSIYRAFSEEPHLHADIRGWLGVPMLVGDRIVGMIALDKNEPGFYTEEHARLAQTFAAQAAVAIENSRLYDEAHQRARNLQTLQKLALTINSSLELDETLKATCRAAVEFLAADHSGMVIFEPDLTKGYVSAEYPAAGTLGTEIPLKGILAEERLVEHREALVFENVAEEESLGPVRDILGGFDVQSVLIVPVISRGGDLLGSLSLDSVGATRTFTAEEVKLCKVFAAHVAVAVENARLFSGLAEASQWRAALIEHAFDTLIAIDENKKITVFNKQAEQLFGRKAEDVTGRRTVGELYYEIEKAREVDQVLKQVGAISGWEVEIKYRDGTRVPVLLSATVLRDSQGRPIGQAGFMRDRRQVRLLEGRLRALMGASQAVAGTLVLGDVLELIVEAAVTAFPSARDGFIRLHDEQADSLRLQASTHSSDHKSYDALDLRVGEGIAGWVFQQRSPVNIADARQDARYRRQRGAKLPPLKSIISVPLQAQGRVIGTLSLENREIVGAFQDQDLGLIRSFADQAAIAIVNAQLFQETQESKENIESLYEASSALISAQEPEQVLQDIVERARLAAEASWVSVILVDEGGQARGLVRAGRDKGTELGNLIRADGLTMQVMRTGKAVAVEDRDKERERVNPGMFRNGVAAAVCLPLSLQGRQIGVMWIHYDQPRRFPEHEIDALQLYVNQASIAYDSASRMRELEHMRQAAEAMAGKAEIHEVLDQIAASARDVLGGDSAAIWSYDDVRGKFIPKETKFAGIPDEAVQGFRKSEPKESGTARSVMERGWIGVVDIEDPTKYDFEMGPSTMDLLASIGARSFQGIALKVGDENLGVLYVNYDQPRSFGRKGKKTLVTFAHHAALALKKARLLEQVRKTKKAAEVVAQVTVLGELGESLRAVVQGTRKAMDSDAVVLFVYDQDTGKLEHPPTMEGVRFPGRASRSVWVEPDSIVYTILQEADLYIVERVVEDDLFNDKRFARDEQIESCVAIPLRAAEQKVGVMFVNYRTRHRFTEDELTNLELFSNQAAVAIQNAQLYERRQRWADVQVALNKASRIITGSLNLDEVLGHIAEQAWKVCRYPGEEPTLFSGVALVEGDTLTHAVAYPSQSIKDFAAIAGGIKLAPTESTQLGIMGRAAVTREAQLVCDVIGDPDYVEAEPQTRSELAVPMLVGSEVIGVVNVERAEPDAFRDEDVMALQSLAAQAGLAIQHARLYQAERRHAQAMEAIQATSSAVSAILDIEELLPMITEEAAGIFSAPASSLMLWDEHKKYLVIRAAFGLGDRYRHEQRIARSTVDGLIETEGLRPHVFEIAQVPFGRPDLIEEEQLCTVLVAPLVKGEELIGILCVYSRNEPRPFGAREEELARVFANHAAIAIQNAQLYDEANERAAVLQTLYEAGKAVTSTLTLNEILNQIVKQACNLATPDGQPTHYSHLALVEGKRIWFEAANSPEIREELLGSVGELDLEHSPRIGIVGRAVNTRESQNVGDTTQDPDYVELRCSTRSQLAVPVVIGDRVFGVINVEHPEFDAFDQEDQEALEHLAAQAAVAIQNARQYEELGKTQGLVGARTALAWMGMASTSWRHAIEGHAISIREQTQHLRSDMDLGLPVNHRLDTIKQLADKILDKPITPPLSTEEGVESVPIGDLIRERLTQLWSYKPYNEARQQLDVGLEDCATVRASPAWLKEALDVLIDNAIEAMTYSKAKQVAVSIRPLNEGVEISIADTGMGIPEDVLPRLLHEPIRKAKGVKGQGMGLLMAQTIIQAYGGEIYVKFTGPAGTTMAIWLPLEAESEQDKQEQGSDSVNED